LFSLSLSVSAWCWSLMTKNMAKMCWLAKANFSPSMFLYLLYAPVVFFFFCSFSSVFFLFVYIHWKTLGSLCICPCVCSLFYFASSPGLFPCFPFFLPIFLCLFFPFFIYMSLHLSLFPSPGSVLFFMEKPENGFCSCICASWSWGTFISVSLRRNRGASIL
jgi:hypothetical protein